MKLIDAPIGIFRFDGELVLKTEYKSENRQSGKYIPDCYIVRTGEYFWGGAKTANELNNLDVEPVDFAELLPTVTDTISRKTVTDAIEKCHKQCCREDATGDEWIHYETTLNEVESIPSAPTTEIATDINVGDKDIISRKAAIEEIKRWLGYIDDDMVRRIQIGMKRLPSVQPESKRGKWILVCNNNGMHFICNKCGAWRYHQEQNFCGECGRDMRGEQDD